MAVVDKILDSVRPEFSKGLAICQTRCPCPSIESAVTGIVQKAQASCQLAVSWDSRCLHSDLHLWFSGCPAPVAFRRAAVSLELRNERYILTVYVLKKFVSFQRTAWRRLPHRRATKRAPLRNGRFSRATKKFNLLSLFQRAPFSFLFSSHFVYSSSFSDHRRDTVALAQHKQSFKLPPPTFSELLHCNM